MRLLQISRWYLGPPLEPSKRWVPWENTFGLPYPFVLMGTFFDLASSMVSLGELEPGFEFFSVTCFQCYRLEDQIGEIVAPFQTKLFEFQGAVIAISFGDRGLMTRVDSNVWKLPSGPLFLPPTPDFLVS